MKASISILITGLLAAVAGCEQSSEVKVEHLAVVNINPSPGAVGIGRDVDVTVTFSSVLDGLTVSPSSMCLNGSDLDDPALDLENPCGTGSPVAATVLYDALTLSATLFPGDALATNTSGGVSYSLFLTPQISGQESGALPALVRSTFTTMPE